MAETIKHTQRLDTVPRCHGSGYWQSRHMAAVQSPRDREIPIVGMLRGWLNYADHHAYRYESGIGEDGVLGPQWAAIGMALLQLLNGELGRLDGGTLDGLIRGVMQDEGFDPDTM